MMSNFGVWLFSAPMEAHERAGNHIVDAFSNQQPSESQEL